jgi:hypothetical protein
MLLLVAVKERKLQNTLPKDSLHCFDVKYARML